MEVPDDDDRVAAMGPPAGLRQRRRSGGWQWGQAVPAPRNRAASGSWQYMIAGGWMGER